MVNRYSYERDKDTKLSEHFSVGEFRSHVNGELTTDDIYIDTRLIELLEMLMAKLGTNKAIITSGYRDSTCDKKVGGTGKGKHVDGMACDIVFYGTNGQAIDTKLVSCLAQDVGFGGIARINSSAIHLDTREGKKYYGDETIGTNTVTTDFYEYYGISRYSSKKYRQQVKDRFGFDESTITYLENHPYPDALFEKLATKG